MERTASLNVDPVFGIQYRAVRRTGEQGWEAQWRPLRAIRTFPTFSYIPRREKFPTEEDALEFVRRNTAAIVSRAI